MIPKVGDIVKLNHDFLKVWFKGGNEYFEKEVWEENLTITGIENSIDEIFVKFKSKDYKYGLYISFNGEFPTCSKEYKGIQVFIPANISETKKDNIYCSCGGPKKENWVFGERFYVCTICKKEVIV